MDHLGFITVFHLFDARIGDGTEVFSIMRSIRLTRKAFLDRYYDDGSFHGKDLQDE